MTELKKCPFCGGEAEVKSYDPFDGYQGNCKLWLIQCAGCGVLLKRRMEKEAIEAWNRRAE